MVHGFSQSYLNEIKLVVVCEMRAEMSNSKSRGNINGFGRDKEPNSETKNQEYVSQGDQAGQEDIWNNSRETRHCLFPPRV